MTTSTVDEEVYQAVVSPSMVRSDAVVSTYSDDEDDIVLADLTGEFWIGNLNDAYSGIGSMPTLASCTRT
jgi:hypothetical protein